MAQSVKHWPLGSGPDPQVLGGNPALGSKLSRESAPPFPSAAPPTCALYQISK